MKPMGTITKYYPFIDEETKSILNTLMDESSSYYDFVQRLAGVVLEKEASVDLVFIAAGQTWRVAGKELAKAIAAKYGDMVCIRPWRHVYGVSQPYQLEIQQDIKDDLDLMIKSSADDWMVTELLLMNSWGVYSHLQAANMLSTAQEIMSRNSDLRCFEYLYHLGMGLTKWHEASPSEAIAHFEMGLQLARAQGNTYAEFYSLLHVANTTKSIDCSKSLELFDQAYQIAQDLEVPFLIADLLSDSSMAYEILGEYDLAITSQLDGLNVYSSGGMEIPYIILSRLYAALGNGQESLEWANRAIELNPAFGLLHLRKVHALVLLNRLDEAEEVLNIASRLSLQTGHDRDVSRYNMALGLFEMAKGELLTAKRTLEQAYEISSRMKDGTTMNEVMISLAKVELAQFMESKSSVVAGPGKWLSTLEDHASNQNLPGIAMQAAIIKSELFQSQGQLRDASQTLQQALEISDSPGVKTLRMNISTRIQELERLMQDEELVS